MNKKDTNPFVNGTPEDVALVENGYYVIQIGADFFSYEDKMAFTLERAEHFKETILEGLRDMIKSKDPLEVEDAKRCFPLLHIYPLRIH